MSGGPALEVKIQFIGFGLEVNSILLVGENMFRLDFKPAVYNSFFKINIYKNL